MSGVEEYEDLIKLYTKLYTCERSAFYNCFAMLEFIDDCKNNIEKIKESENE